MGSQNTDQRPPLDTEVILEELDRNRRDPAWVRRVTGDGDRYGLDAIASPPSQSGSGSKGSW